ncbi:hypothetical protein THOM_3216 [Trachipleistophora hominis]|uniref:Ribosome biogenesis protein BMS1/TSR1 C-terminal domain-containing protein n=1 Tax=Trachipleistophora hominis TaxID=72359 RepID=L7JS18_TRAHO|nr:hypothetical protein THOM_3216 [Trachipleistophora hominis]
MPSHKKAHLQKLKLVQKTNASEQHKYAQPTGAYKPLLILTQSSLRSGITYQCKTRYKIMNACDYPAHIVRMLSKVCVTVSFDMGVSADIMCYEGTRHARRQKVRGTWCHVDDLYKCARFVKRRAENVPVIVVDGGREDIYEGVIDYEMVSDEVMVNGMDRCKVIGLEYLDEAGAVIGCYTNGVGTNEQIKCVDTENNVTGALIEGNAINSTGCDGIDCNTPGSTCQCHKNVSYPDENVENNADHGFAMEECSSEDTQPSHITPLMESFKGYRGIKDLKTCTIHTGYSFKPPKACKLKKCDRLVRVRLSKRFDGDVFFISNVVVDDTPCILNVRFNERMDGGLENDNRNCGCAGINTANTMKYDKEDMCMKSCIDKMSVVSNEHVDTITSANVRCNGAHHAYTLEYGMFLHKVTPYFTMNTSSSVFKLQDESLKSGVVSFKVPYTPTNTPVKLFHAQKLVLSSNTYDHKERVIVEERVISGKPYKAYGTWCKIKNMFVCRDDVLFFRHVKLIGRGGNVGWIRSSVGVKGVFKAEFERPVKQGDEVRMCLYRLVEIV